MPAEGLALLHRAGFRLIVVSNQSGVARGRFAGMALEPRASPAASGCWRTVGVALAGFYYCPHHPDGRRAADTRRSCRCRKPQPGLIARAAREHGIDLVRSWFVGDILDDVEAGRRAGCRTVLIDNGNETEWKRCRWRWPDSSSPDLAEAARLIVEAGRGGAFSGRLAFQSIPSIPHVAPVEEPGGEAMTVRDEWGLARNILCVRLDALGDVLMTTPALRALKDARTRPADHPADFAVRGGSRPLVPEVDDVIVYEAPWMKATAVRPDSRLDHAMIRRLDDARFDAAVIFTVYSQNPLPAAMLCYSRTSRSGSLTAARTPISS